MHRLNIIPADALKANSRAVNRTFLYNGNTYILHIPTPALQRLKRPESVTGVAIVGQELTNHLHKSRHS